MQNDSALLQKAPITAEPAGAKEMTKRDFQYKETQDLVQLVEEAATLLHTQGETAFIEFRVPGSRWRSGENYIFVLDLDGNMLVHADPGLEGKNQLELKDINGKPIIQGLLEAATAVPQKPEGWYHYQWVVPGGLLPRWKSSFVQLVKTPSGESYVVGSGMYNDRMEREFVVDMITKGITILEKEGENAFDAFRDPKGPFLVKNDYLFISDMEGTVLVDPGFPNLEGQNIQGVKDTEGKYFVRELLNVVQTTGSGWVDYMWPRAGESVSTQKSTYVSKAKVGDRWLLLGCGVYLSDAPKEVPATKKMTATELMELVREEAWVFEAGGERAFVEFREKGFKWFRDDTYFFAWTMDGVRVFHAPNPTEEGKDIHDLKDVLGRPVGRMVLEAAKSPSGEGWVHYMYPEPGQLFPVWKSTFVKRVTFPSGKQYLIGCGVYNMQMDKAFIEDVVNKAVALIEQKGRQAFAELRDRKGAFVFMDTYVFVMTPDGTELVNGGQPALEGRNLLDLKDLEGRATVKDEAAIAMAEGNAWLKSYWFKPGGNTMAPKQTYVRKAQYGEETFIVGSGFYAKEEPVE